MELISPLDLLIQMPCNADDGYDVMKTLNFSFELHSLEYFADDSKCPLKIDNISFKNSIRIENMSSFLIVSHPRYC